MTGEFPAQRASNAVNVSIWWRHHGLAVLSSKTIGIDILFERPTAIHDDTDYYSRKCEFEHFKLSNNKVAIELQINSTGLP